MIVRCLNFVAKSNSAPRSACFEHLCNSSAIEDVTKILKDKRGAQELYKECVALITNTMHNTDNADVKNQIRQLLGEEVIVIGQCYCILSFLLLIGFTTLYEQHTRVIFCGNRLLKS